MQKIVLFCFTDKSPESKNCKRLAVIYKLLLPSTSQSPKLFLQEDSGICVPGIRFATLQIQASSSLPLPEASNCISRV